MKRPSIGWTGWGLLIHALAASAVLAAGAVLDGSAVLAAEPAAPAAPNAVQFGRDVLPILSDHCFACHGPDAKNRAGDLRLDTSEGALRQESPVIVPGKSDASELVRRISSQDPDQVMPPPSTKRPLTARQIDVLRRWIDSGAAWGRHWAYEPARRPAVPAPREAAGIKNPIDAFIRERLEREGLRPAPEMSREKLLRRVTLDLTGLPPTLEELDAFLADTSPDAYEQVVDRLLRSPRYGERMVWEWLDAARYADTNGYQGDPTRSMWFWRDWAIDALNANMPFDQFTIEQLAGDLLPAPTQSQLIATGFHRNHMINGEGGRIAEESRIDYVQDRVETTGAVWMGLTLNCCRCHDHKYDPLTQREYYQLFAYFNSIDESGGADAFPHGRPVLQVKTPEIESKLAELRAVEMRADEAVRETEKTARERQAEWEAALRATPSSDKSADKPTGSAVWQPIVWQRVESKSGATATLAEDQTIVVGGANPAKDDLVARGEFRGRNVTGLRLETLPDAAFVNKGPGRADNGNYVLTELKVLLDGKPVALRNAAADFAQDGWAPAGVLDGKSESGWAIMPKFGEPHVLTVETVEPLGDGAAHELTVVLEHQSPHVAHVIGKFRLSTTTLPPAEWRGLPPTVAAILGKPVEQRGDAERKELADFYLSTRPEVATARQTRDRARQAREQAEKQIPTTMIMRERAQPRETRMLVRGAWDKPSDPVSHGVPAALPALPADAPANRLALARWLVSAEHPLTARVTVNRLWQQLFGAGLVKTSEDFGIQGERPSHPELLDWLACEFREPTVDQPTVRPAEAANAWNVKHMVRLIVTSATYRQSSKVSAEQWERDPENRLLARGPRYRWPSWMIRDQALAASGLLVDKRGGPPVRGYQPPGIWEEATFGKIGYSQDHGEALYRRSVYQFWRRIVGPTVFFDVANRQTCVVRGARTNTPLHALVTLNDVTYVEAARALAQTVLKTAAANDRERLTSAFRRCTARVPRADELDLLAVRLDRLRQSFAQDQPAAKKLVATGESPVEANLDPVELAAFTSVALLILNLDETQSNEQRTANIEHRIADSGWRTFGGHTCMKRRPLAMYQSSEQPLSTYPLDESRRLLTRRALFGRAGQGVGLAALATLLGRDCAGALGAEPARQRFGGLPDVPHFAPKANRVIYLLQNGAPPHLDMFDYKPQMEKLRGTELPESVHRNQKLSTMTAGQKSRAVLPAFTGFRQHGQCGAWVCDFLPHTAKIVDDACFIKSMHTTQVNHAPAITFFLTGAELPGRPSMGAWATYGLGSDTQDLPAFVVMTSRDKEASCGQIFYDFYWGSGFLPSKFQGVKFRGSGDPVLYLSNPDGMSRDVRRGLLDDLARLNELQLKETGDPEIATRIAQYEMAYRMQMSVPDLTNLDSEPAHVIDRYGPDVRRPGSFAYNCLMARRLVERGVRFVQMFHAGWDHHRNLSTQFEIQCRDTDQPSAALVQDLKQRGLLDETLVVWGGEFGRTPFCQGDINDRKTLGRDHHPYCFTLWMAGGGVKPGFSYGESDDFAYNVARDPVDPHDLQATIMHLLGIDHERLTFKFQGRYFRLTDVHGKVVKPILA